MADYNLDLAIEYLGELTDSLSKIVKRGGLKEVKDVLWVLKGWSKIATIILGGNYHRRNGGYWIMKGDPSTTTSKRDAAMLRAMEDYESLLNNNHTRGGDIFNNADKAVRDFVWDYRKGLDKKKEAELIHGIQDWMNLTEDKMMQTPLFQMERHA